MSATPASSASSTAATPATADIVRRRRRVRLDHRSDSPMPPSRQPRRHRSSHLRAGNCAPTWCAPALRSFSPRSTTRRRPGRTRALRLAERLEDARVLASSRGVVVRRERPLGNRGVRDAIPRRGVVHLVHLRLHEARDAVFDLLGVRLTRPRVGRGVLPREIHVRVEDRPRLQLVRRERARHPLRHVVNVQAARLDEVDDKTRRTRADAAAGSHERAGPPPRLRASQHHVSLVRQQRRLVEQRSRRRRRADLGAPGHRARARRLARWSSASGHPRTAGGTRRCEPCSTAGRCMSSTPSVLVRQRFTLGRRRAGP